MEFGLSLKIIGILLLVVVLASSSSESEKKDNEIEDQRSVATFNTQRANMNDYLDVVMEGVADWMREGGVTPFDLPDLREGFSYKPLLIEYSGWVDMSNGRMLDIARVTRAGDCFMSYNRLLLSVEVEAALTEMTFFYNYVTTIMSLGIFDGYVDGAADNIVIHCDFLIDMYDFHIFMQDFEVKSIGSIDVRLRGNLLTDWIGNIMINIITTLFKGTITQIVSDRVKIFVQEALDKINAGNQFGKADSKSDMLESLRVLMAKQGIQLPKATGH